MSETYAGIGKPTKNESLRRTARFLTLVANGTRYREAAKLAGVKTDRALDLVNDPDLPELLDQLREQEAAA